MHQGIGTVKYFNDEWKVNIIVDDELANYYRSLIPKYYNVARQKYQTHITLVRNEEIVNKLEWRKYEGKKIKFQYSNVRSGKVYWWLDAYGDFLLKLRTELGLPYYSDQTRPPDKKNCFHITIGNTK